MKYFNTKEDYYQFITNWKTLAFRGAFKNSPHMFIVYNILKDREPLYGFSRKTKCHVLFLMYAEIYREISLVGFVDQRSTVLRLLDKCDLDVAQFIQDLKTVNKDIIKKARSLATD
jgi:hypothetical protein